jgi:hypothetical protein
MTRRRSYFTVHSRGVTPRSFAPQTQAFLAVNPIQPILADIPAFTPKHHENPAIPESNSCLSELAHTLTKRDLWILAAAVSVRRSAHPGATASSPQANRIPPHQVAHDFTPLDGLHHFF